jgi:dihydroxyacetone kinase-like predicted kinase
MNPSTEDFLEAFNEANADTIFVFPNNSNIILAAKQAAGMYKGSEIVVIESHTIGEGYAALSMLSYDSNDTEIIKFSEWINCNTVEDFRKIKE